MLANGDQRLAQASHGRTIPLVPKPERLWEKASGRRSHSNNAGNFRRINSRRECLPTIHSIRARIKLLVPSTWRAQRVRHSIDVSRVIRADSCDSQANHSEVEGCSRNFRSRRGYGRLRVGAWFMKAGRHGQSNPTVSRPAMRYMVGDATLPVTSRRLSCSRLDLTQMPRASRSIPLTPQSPSRQTGWPCARWRRGRRGRFPWSARRGAIRRNWRGLRRLWR